MRRARRANGRGAAASAGARGAAITSALVVAFVVVIAALAAACRRAEPLGSCRDSLAGIWRVESTGGEPERWALIDRGTRLEGYPLFDDTEAAAAGRADAKAHAGDDLVLSPRSLDLIRSHTSLLGHVERWVMRGGQKCQLRANARVYACGHGGDPGGDTSGDTSGDTDGDTIEVQLAALPVPMDLAACAAPPPAAPPAPPQRWRRER